MLCLRVEIIFLFSYILQVSYLNKKNKEKHKVGNKCPLSLLESHCGQAERFISVFLCFNKCITHRSGLVSSTHMTLFLVQTHHCPFHGSEKVLHVGRKFSILTEKAHDACWSDGVWALFPLLGPGLEVLQGVQRGVVGTQWVGHRWFAEGLLEGGLLQLHDEAIGLLTLRFPLLGGLPPKKGTLKFMRSSKHPEMICVIVRSSLNCKSTNDK